MLKNLLAMNAKDRTGTFVFANDLMVSEMGYDSKSHILGRSEYDVAKEVFSDALCSTDVLVDQFLMEDERIFRGEELNKLYVLKWRGNIKFRIGYKFGQRNERGKIISAMQSSYEISKPTQKQVLHLLSMKDKGLFISKESEEYIHQYLQDLQHKLILNPRELECVAFLGKGKTAKAIAQRLGLSHRTVEFYLDNAKNKLNCANSHELIAKCFEKGWIDISEEF